MMRTGFWVRRLGSSVRRSTSSLAGAARFARENRYVLAFTASAAAFAIVGASSADLDNRRTGPDGKVRAVRYLPGSVVECAGEKRFSIHELSDQLSLRLGPIRAKLREQGCPAPTVAVAQYGVKDQTHALEILLPKYVSIASILAGALKFTGEAVQLRANGDSMGIISTAGGCSVLLEPVDGDIKIGVYKDVGFTQSDLDAYTQWYRSMCFSLRASASLARRQRGTDPTPSGTDESSSSTVVGSREAIFQELSALGVGVYQKSSDGGLDWDCIAGYDDVKREIQDSILMPLQHPEEYDKIATGTRVRFESNRPRAILFEGPPGTGKTLSARIIAEQCGIPLIHVPLESIVTKWFGESERNLAKVFEKAEELGGAIIFIDEVDALGVSRDAGEMHEASRRVLSVLLQRLDGFKGRGKSTLICATNRKQDLDAALANRFGMTLHFGLPDLDTRKKVLKRYARHMKDSELAELAQDSRGMSCRDLKEICEHTERKWAAKRVRKERVPELPVLDEYKRSLHDRLESANRHKASVRM